MMVKLMVMTTMVDLIGGDNNGAHDIVFAGLLTAFSVATNNS